MKSSEIKFLKELQQELLTQDKLCQADPRFWVIRDYRWDIVPDEYAEQYRIYDSEGDSWTVKQFNEHLNNSCDYDEVLNGFDLSDIENADKHDWYDIVDALNEEFGTNEFKILGVVENTFIVPDTMFLTNREAKEHLKKNDYHYTSKAHTFAMTAWRSPQVERLIHILQTADFEEEMNE